MTLVGSSCYPESLQGSGIATNFDFVSFEGDTRMDIATGTALLILAIIVFLAAVYWTVFKIRAELSQSQERIIAELSEIRKLLDTKTGKE
jgi:hypothetical protein